MLDTSYRSFAFCFTWLTNDGARHIEIEHQNLDDLHKQLIQS